MNDGSLVHAKLHLAGLQFPDALGDVECDRAGLGVGHQAARTEHFAEPPHGFHHVRRGDDRVEIQPAALDSLDQVVSAHFIGAGLAPFAHLVTGSDDDYPLRLAQAVRQHHRATNHLVGVLGIHAQPDGELDRLVEFGERGFFDERHRVGHRVSGLVYEFR